MPSGELDDVDEGILFLLQGDARNVTTKTIAEKLGVASSTVANRIKNLEERDVIRSYRPDIDYGQTEYDHHLLVVGTAPPGETERLVDEALEVRGVVGSRELLTDRKNVRFEVIGATQDDVERSVEGLSDVGVSVVRTEILKRERQQPFDGFGRQFTSE